jgi:hypothetical protein
MILNGCMLHDIDVNQLSVGSSFTLFVCLFVVLLSRWSMAMYRDMELSPRPSNFNPTLILLSPASVIKVAVLSVRWIGAY